MIINENQSSAWDFHRFNLYFRGIAWRAARRLMRGKPAFLPQRWLDAAALHETSIDSSYTSEASLGVPRSSSHHQTPPEHHQKITRTPHNWRQQSKSEGLGLVGGSKIYEKQWKSTQQSIHKQCTTNRCKNTTKSFALLR